MNDSIAELILGLWIFFGPLILTKKRDGVWCMVVEGDIFSATIQIIVGGPLLWAAMFLPEWAQCALILGMAAIFIY